MKVVKHFWDSFLNENKFDLHPITRNPMTGEWPTPNELILNLLTGSFESIKSQYIELPDEWFLPVTKKDLPPKDKQKIHAYILSEIGFNHLCEHMKNAWKNKKYSFEEYADCLIANANHYNKTLEKRKIKK